MRFAGSYNRVNDMFSGPTISASSSSSSSLTLTPPPDGGIDVGVPAPRREKSFKVAASISYNCGRVIGQIPPRL